MYIPSAFQVDDPAVLFSLMQRYSFASLVTMEGSTPVASHLPFLVQRHPQHGDRLLGHMARANPQWKSFESASEVLVIFEGPHAYVSPSWYVTKPSVPTWNYAVVHAYGTPRRIEEPAAVVELLRELTALHEAGFKSPWEMDLPGDTLAQLVRAIVAFEIRITRLEGKFKLSQNRSAEDRAGVITVLSQSTSPQDRELASLMEAPPRALKPGW